MKKVFLCLMIALLSTTLTVGCGKKDADKNSSKEEANSNEKCEGTNEELNGLKGDTVGYYYNIDTSKFDKTLFDGNVNFYGATINGKITTNKLKAAGINVEGSPTSKNGYSIYYFPKFSIDTSSDILNNDLPMDGVGTDLYLVDYTGGTNLYSDSTLVSLGLGTGWNLTGRDIYPSQLGVSSYKEITIDLLLEKLGNPTYVRGRVNSCLESLYTYTEYIYVYDDVAFLYAFYNWNNMKLAAAFYYPIEEFNGTMASTYTYDEKEYNNYIDLLNAYQQKYKENQK